MSQREIFDGVCALTFDCYGTLIDWLGGIRAGLAGVHSLAHLDLDRLVRDRDELDGRVVSGPFRPYGELLQESVRLAAELQGAVPLASELETFAEGMGDWPPFPDSPSALARLARRFRLAILSNVEDRILARSVAQLDAPFETLITAEQVRSYKPAPAHFHEALERLRLEREQVVHVACSPFHDLRPAQRLGWRTVWVRRDGGELPRDVRPSRIAGDLAELAGWLE